MFRKIISSLFLTLGFLMVVTILAAAQGGGQEVNQMDMGTPTAMVSPEATPVSDLPLSGDLPLSETQTGTCPMMGGMGMTGAGSMSGMNMEGMTGMGTSGMSGISGMQGMSGMNMGTMPGMDMTGTDGMTMNLSTPWYSNPWLLLGWVLLTLVALTILVGAVYIIRRSRSVPASEAS